MKQLKFFSRKNGETVAAGNYDESRHELVIETTNEGYQNILTTLALEVETALGEKYEIKQENLELVIANISPIGVIRIKQIMISRYTEIGIEELELNSVTHELI